MVLELRIHMELESIYTLMVIYVEIGEYFVNLGTYLHPHHSISKGRWAFLTHGCPFSVLVHFSARFGGNGLCYRVVV